MTILAARYDAENKAIRFEDLHPDAITTVLGDSPSRLGVNKLYEAVPWLFAAVNLRAEALSGVPYDLCKKGETEAIAQPENLLPYWSKMPDILDGMEADRVLTGAAYVLKIKNAFGKVIDLRRLAPQSITPKYDKEKGLTHFKRSVGGQPVKLELEDVIYSWLPNRNVETGPGSPPTKAALQAAGALRSIDQFSTGYFERGAVKAMLIDVDPKVGGNSEAERERLENWVQRKIQGVKNAFAVSVGRRKLNVHEIGQGTGDLALPELTNQKREDIATAIGVPQSLLFSNATNFATAQADTLNFHDKTIKPEGRKIQAALNDQLFWEMGLEFKFAPKRLEVYQALELQKADTVSRTYRDGLISLNEARGVMDMQPVEGGDERLAAPAPQITSDSTVADITALTKPKEPAKADTEKWKRKAVKRYTEGNPAKALEFVSEHIGASLQAAIRGALEAVTTAAEVSQVFDGVLSWEAYP